MKKNLYKLAFIVGVFLTNDLWAQAPAGLYYQSYVRDNNGNPIADKSVSLKFSILSEDVSGPVVYEETHVTQTNDDGLVTLVIGKGTATSGLFSAINWESGAKFLKVELDDDGGSNFSEMGITELLSVPYALYASKAGNVDDAIQQLEIDGNTLSITSGNSVSLPANNLSSNPRFPDGISGTTIFLTYGDTYEVPEGKTFYRVDENSEINVPYLAGEGTQIVVPIPTGDLNGDGEITGDDTPGAIGSVGILVDKGVEIVKHALSGGNSYTVPGGKTLHIIKLDASYEISERVTIGGLSYEAVPEVALPGGTVVGGCEEEPCTLYGYLK